MFDESKKNANSYGELAVELLSEISKIYWSKMFHYIKDNNIDINNVNCFIIDPESIILYFSKEYLAIEYCGNPFSKVIQPKSQKVITLNDWTKENITTQQFMEKIIGFQFDGSSGVVYPLISDLYEDLVLPTNAGMEKLIDLKWNFAAQNHSIGFNADGIDIVGNQFVRLINCTFFDCKNNDLKTRTIKWMDFLPLKYDDTLEGEYDELKFNFSEYSSNWLRDMFYQYPEPVDYKYDKLPKMNHFIELFGDSTNSETDITSFLEQDENKFIMTMAFQGIRSVGQVECKWQSENRPNIKPDFFVLKANGYADIVEFKLPNIKHGAIVGRNNRENFSSEINSYIAQTRVYQQYFDDPNNQMWCEKEHDIKAYKPRRYLVVGRRSDFEAEVWMEIKAQYQDLEIITYDDLVDTVVAQFYQ
ncbi:uncharacterized protein DUF4263 [Muricomes intestini]|jgi:hypothetical protein|uniref:Uncharacterized protein DUF4263 n=1 Tax=Muricomes intestini TaxID=1796634 RepID=A0A4V2US70_9FIRM|nr:Shedu anti-phage system protein SduA domain-containing protein [Muricomes intestini]TCS80322.1 uncharacterized protein DUF4263 [Muricomes intestini]